MKTETASETAVGGVSPFATVKRRVADRWAFLQTQGTILTVDPDRDRIWETYINHFETIEAQAEHTCSACKSFIRTMGGVVSIDDNGKVCTIWDIDPDLLPDIYHDPILALREYVRSLPIKGLFYHSEPSAGVDKNWDPKRNVTWEHFHAKIPRAHVGDLGSKASQLRGSFDVLKRSLNEIDPGAVATVLELIDQGSLYRGTEYRHLVDGLRKRLDSHQQLFTGQHDPFVWKLATTIPDAEARVGNTAIGTLLYDLSEGKDLEKAVGAFERMVAPANYRRPTALVTPRMVEAAKERLEELGLISALNRRILDSRDLTADRALFVYRPQVAVKDVFAEIAGEQPVDPKTLSKVEEVGIADFMTKVLPTAKTIRVLVERSHLGNFSTLTGPVDADAPGLMKWGNSFAWSYTGGVADSIKEKVKAAGGRVDGWLNARLAWSNHDDLDLHFQGPRTHVYYMNKRANGVRLDVDMNAGFGQTREPVENIDVDAQLPPGNYEIGVHQYCARDPKDKGYELEIEVNGEVRSFSAASPRNGAMDRYPFTVGKDGTVTFTDSGKQTLAKGVVKWGIKTNQWHMVRAITLSPNHWDTKVGNKHVFFLLEGAVSDEATRPFYNEFFVDDLAKDRKVTEVLASKIQVAKADGAELSGLGFSETLRNHLFVEVEGNFKRTIKVLF